MSRSLARDACLERARYLHARHPVVDTLAPKWDSEMYISPKMVRLAQHLKSQGATRVAIQQRLATHLLAEIGRDEDLRQEYLAWWSRSGVTAACTTVYFAGPPSRSWDAFVAGVARSTALAAILHEKFGIALSPSDVIEAHERGRHAVILSLQNADPIGDDLDKLDVVRRLGVRIVQPTYNLRNLFGDGCVERRDGGLSRFGVELIERLNARRMIVDLSHCSDLTLLDALEASEQPIAVTHTCSRQLGGHPRGKSDEILRRLAERGCYVGVLIVPGLLRPGTQRVTLDDVVDHIDHVMNIVGSDAIGIGSDWGKPYYQVMEWGQDVAERPTTGEFDWVGWRPEHNFRPNDKCIGMETWDLWPNLTGHLLQRDYDEDTVIKIIGANFLRFWSEVVGPEEQGSTAPAGVAI